MISIIGKLNCITSSILKTADISWFAYSSIKMGLFNTNIMIPLIVMEPVYHNQVMSNLRSYMRELL